MRQVLFRLMVVALTLVGCGPREAAQESDEKEALPPAASDSTATAAASKWEPKGAYWGSYRAVLVHATCDSLGQVKDTDLLHSYASPAEADSILELARGLALEPKSTEGRMWWWEGDHPSDPDIHYILPFVTHGHDSTTLPAPISRKDLEKAGLGPWLDLWDEVLPDWPVETWSLRWRNRLHEYPPDVFIDDAELVARNLVSISPDRAWRLHRFLGAEFTPEGEMAFDVDSGYLVYRSRPPQRARGHVTGPASSYTAAEWIDSKRFVVVGIGEADIAYGGKGIGYPAPMLILGHVDSLDVTSLLGPPMPRGSGRIVRDRLDAYLRQRYPVYWEQSR